MKAKCYKSQLTMMSPASLIMSLTQESSCTTADPPKIFQLDERVTLRHFSYTTTPHFFVALVVHSSFCDAFLAGCNIRLVLFPTSSLGTGVSH